MAFLLQQLRDVNNHYSSTSFQDIKTFWSHFPKTDTSFWQSHREITYWYKNNTTIGLGKIRLDSYCMRIASNINVLWIIINIFAAFYFYFKVHTNIRGVYWRVVEFLQSLHIVNTLKKNRKLLLMKSQEGCWMDSQLFIITEITAHFTRPRSFLQCLNQNLNRQRHFGSFKCIFRNLLQDIEVT